MKFKYKNDAIEVHFKRLFLGLVMRRLTLPYFYSSNYAFEFYSFSHYWRELGKRSALVQFISSRLPGKYGPKYYTIDEVVQRIARLDLGDNTGIILYNIDLAKIERLMYMFAGVSPEVFRKGEFVVFPTNNKEAAQKLTYSIPSSIADVTGFADGYIYCTNRHVTE